MKKQTNYLRTYTMKAVALVMAMGFLTTGCAVPVKAVTVTHRPVVVAGPYRHKHGKPKKVVVVVGQKVKVRPVRSVVIYYQNIPYLYADGVYYKTVNQEYEVIKPQIGMVVPELPGNGVSEIRIKDEVYYSYDNVLYKEIPTQSGVQFVVEGFVNE